METGIRTAKSSKWKDKVENPFGLFNPRFVKQARKSSHPLFECMTMDATPAARFKGIDISPVGQEIGIINDGRAIDIRNDCQVIDINPSVRKWETNMIVR